jgi:hypothetical protein
VAVVAGEACCRRCSDRTASDTGPPWLASSFPGGCTGLSVGPASDDDDSRIGKHDDQAIGDTDRRDEAGAFFDDGCLFASARFVEPACRFDGERQISKDRHRARACGDSIRSGSRQSRGPADGTNESNPGFAIAGNGARNGCVALASGWQGGRIETCDLTDVSRAKANDGRNLPQDAGSSSPTAHRNKQQWSEVDHEHAAVACRDASGCNTCGADFCGIRGCDPRAL